MWRVGAALLVIAVALLAWWPRPEHTDGAAPVNAVETTHSLFLEVVSDETHDVVPMPVDLWRDGRRARRLQTPGTAEELPAGVYRAVCLGARFDSEDPAPFRVEGEARVQLRVPAPHVRRVSLLVVDARGEPVREGSLTTLSSDRRARDPNPAWARERVPHAASNEGSSGQLPRTVRSSVGVYTLGYFADDDKTHARSWHSEFRAGDGNRVWLRLDGAGLADRYVGAVVPRADLLRPVVTPAGAPAAPLVIDFDAECFAIPLAGPDRWRDLEISVGVEIEGLPPFRYAYPLENPPKRVEMRTTRPPVPR